MTDLSSSTAAVSSRYDQDDPLRSPEEGFRLLEAERAGVTVQSKATRTSEATKARNAGLFLLFLLGVDLIALLLALWIFGPIGAAIVVGASIIAYAVRSRG